MLFGVGGKKKWSCQPYVFGCCKTWDLFCRVGQGRQQMKRYCETQYTSSQSTLLGFQRHVPPTFPACVPSVVELLSEFVNINITGSNHSEYEIVYCLFCILTLHSYLEGTGFLILVFLELPSEMFVLCLLAFLLPYMCSISYLSSCHVLYMDRKIIYRFLGLGFWFILGIQEVHTDSFTSPASQDIQLLIFFRSIKHLIRVINIHMKHFIYNTALQYLARTFDDSVAETSAINHGDKSTAAAS